MFPDRKNEGLAGRDELGQGIILLVQLINILDNLIIGWDVIDVSQIGGVDVR